MWYRGSIAAFIRQLQLQENSVLCILYSGQNPYFSLMLSPSHGYELPDPNKTRLVCWCFIRRNHPKIVQCTAWVYVHTAQNFTWCLHRKNVSATAAARATVMLLASFVVPVSPSEGTHFPERHVALRQYHHLSLGNFWLGHRALSVHH